jgi:hypothetical protein
MTNESSDGRSIAYEFPHINRSETVFPPAHELVGVKFLRKWNEVNYEYDNRSKETEGFVKYRFVAGVGVWQWGDLLSGGNHKNNPLCPPCSTDAQAIVCHSKKDCPSWRDIDEMPDHCTYVTPDPERIQGKQQSKKSKKTAKVTFPCLFANPSQGECVHAHLPRRAFRSAAAANTHMNRVHETWPGLSAALYAGLFP